MFEDKPQSFMSKALNAVYNHIWPKKPKAETPQQDDAKRPLPAPNNEQAAQAHSVSPNEPDSLNPAANVATNQDLPRSEAEASLDASEQAQPEAATKDSLNPAADVAANQDLPRSGAEPSINDSEQEPTELTPPANSWSQDEQDRLSQAAGDAVFQELPPTEAEVNLGAKYQALQKQDALAESIVAQNEQEPFRSRETRTCNLSAEQATAIIANERHMKQHMTVLVHKKYRSSSEQSQEDNVALPEHFDAPNNTVPAEIHAVDAVPQDSDDAGLAESNNTPEVAAPAEVMTDAPALQDSDDTGLAESIDAPENASHNEVQAVAPEPQNSDDADLAESIDAPENASHNEVQDVDAAPQDSEDAGLAESPDTPEIAAPAEVITVVPAPQDSEDADLAESPDAPENASHNEVITDAPAPQDSEDAGLSESIGTAAKSAADESTAASPSEAAIAQPENTASTAQDSTVPLDFISKATDLDYCREQLKPVMAKLRQQDDTILGKRFAFKRETGNVFYVLEEDIFGPGFHSDERRFHLMLEFLTVLASQNQEAPMDLAQCDEFGRFAFLKRRNLRLRQLLFNNPELAIINSSAQTDEQKWQQWFKQFQSHNTWHLSRQSTTTAPQDDSAEWTENGLAVDIPANTEESSDPLAIATQFEQLKEVCQGKFDRFVTLVNVLRAWSFDTDKDHQWSTMFLFPFGYDALFWEIEKGTNVKQNLMHGAGQIIFSMLARALKQREAAAKDTKLNLGQHLVQRFFTDYNGLNLGAQYLGGGSLNSWAAQHGQDKLDVWSQLLEVREQQALKDVQEAQDCQARLQVNDLRNRISVVIGRYVPYHHLPRYDLLLEDFEAITSLDLTKQELFMHLSSIGMLHLLCFLLEQEQKLLSLPLAGANGSYYQEVKPSDHDINMVLLINPESKDKLRNVARKRLEDNQALFAKARAHYIKAHYSSIVAQCVPELLSKPNLSEDEQLVLCNIMRCAFSFKESMTIDLNNKKLISPKRGDGAEKRNVVLLSKGKITYSDIEQAMINHERDSHMMQLHSQWCQDLGLGSKEGSIKYYYTISDELLYTLVLCLVKKDEPMPVADFLQKLHERYHLVIGRTEAQDRNYPVEEGEFQANEDQFKLKLQRNHLLISLSDSCEYVRNPFN